MKPLCKQAVEKISYLEGLSENKDKPGEYIYRDTWPDSPGIFIKFSTDGDYIYCSSRVTEEEDFYTEECLLDNFIQDVENYTWGVFEYGYKEAY